MNDRQLIHRLEDIKTTGSNSRTIYSRSQRLDKTLKAIEELIQELLAGRQAKIV